MDALTGHALIIISRNDDAMHRGYPVVRAGLTEAQAIAVCNDPRTGGANWFLAHTAVDNLWKWYWKDNGSLDAILSEHGINWKRTP